MAVKRDPTSEWMKGIDDQISDHHSQPLPRSGGGMFGRSAFGFLTQTFGGFLPRIPTVGGMSLGIGPDILDQLERQGKGVLANTILGGIFRSEQIKQVSDRFNQLLELKGGFKFVYGTGSWSAGHLKMELPFYENPNVTETRKANYAVNKIVNRSEPIRLWTGAEARQIKVDFTMTLPHIAEFAIKQKSDHFKNIKGSPMQDAATLENYRKSLKAKLKELNFPDPRSKGLGGAPAMPASQGIPGGFDNKVRDFLGMGGDEGTQGLSKNILGYNDSSEAQAEAELAFYIQQSIDTIRSSVMGSVGGGPQYGPPRVYFSYGTMYRSYPVIVTNYEIKFPSTKAGYHNMSMLPRQIDITLTLEGYHQNLGPGQTNSGGSIVPAEGWDTFFSLESAEGRHARRHGERVAERTRFGGEIYEGDLDYDVETGSSEYYYEDSGPAYGPPYTEMAEPFGTAPIPSPPGLPYPTWANGG